MTRICQHISRSRSQYYRQIAQKPIDVVAVKLKAAVRQIHTEMDASRIIWIATGNYMDNIPSPIKSRMRTFHISQPDKTSMKPVVESIYQHVINNKAFGKLLDNQLDETVIDTLLILSPRSVRLAIEEAAFKAIRNECSNINLTDLPKINKEKYRVGFI